MTNITSGTSMNPAPSSYSGLVPEHVDPDSEYSMRRWRLRRSSRAIRFAQQMLREAYGDAVQGNAHARVPIWLDQGMRITERVVERLRKDLRRKHALQLFQWVSWIRGSENLKVLHGEALTLKDAKEGALRDLRQLQDECTEDIPKYRDGVAVVTGPRGGRQQWGTTYRAKGGRVRYCWLYHIPEWLEKELAARVRAKEASDES